MAKIAFLGLGAMGSRMAANVLKAGHELTVWNRTPDACQPVADLGAAVADTPRAAVAQADFAVSMVRDDAAADLVWLDAECGALAGLRTGAVGIDCSTLTIAATRTLADRFGAAELGFLVGGCAEVLSAAGPILMTMGSSVHHVGPAGSGTTLKLAVNALLGVQVAALAEIIGFFDRAGLNGATAIDILGSTPVCSPAAKAAAASMLSGVFPALFPADLMAKDFGNLLATAGAVAASMPVAAAVYDVFAGAVRHGLGADNLTGIIRLYR
jgi:3-hydroxyisobutyrate dehydrogenase-like beta-hydroxyacid dehydrogenase